MMKVRYRNMEMMLKKMLVKSLMWLFSVKCFALTVTTKKSVNKKESE